MVEGTSQDIETFFLTAWSIWYNRNQKVFEDSCHPLPKYGILLEGSLATSWRLLVLFVISNLP